MTGVGAPDRPERPIDPRATRAEIDLDALDQNIATLRSGLAPEVEVMAVVKANAYGHGALIVASAALAAGATRLAVATVGEGRQLRARGINAPILILSPITAAEAPLAVAASLEITIATPELLDAVCGAAEGASARVPVHVKVDSGMHRYGAAPELAIALSRRVAATPSLRLAGLMTHFASADEPDDDFTDIQAELYDYCLQTLAAEGIRPAHRHLANSAAALRGDRLHGDFVRFGIALYGLRPSPAITLPSGVRPVMTVRSQVSRVHQLLPGETVGYGRTYVASDREQIALIPIGYADGFRRGLSDRAWMLVGSHRAEVTGRVSMDQTVVRLPAGAAANSGDDVVVFGDVPGAPSADDLASILGTISYEVVTGIAARVPRLYLRNGAVIACESLPLA